MVLFYSNRVIVLVKFTEFVSFVMKRERLGRDNGLVRKKSKKPKIKDQTVVDLRG